MNKIINFPNNNNDLINKLVTCKEKDFYETYEMTAVYCQSSNVNNYKSPCGYQFYLHEKNIFPSLDIDTDRNYYRLHCVCPNCGYILTLDKKNLPEKIKNKYNEISSTEIMDLFIKNINKTSGHKR